MIHLQISVGQAPDQVQALSNLLCCVTITSETRLWFSGCQSCYMCPVVFCHPYFQIPFTHNRKQNRSAFDLSLEHDLGFICMIPGRIPLKLVAFKLHPSLIPLANCFLFFNFHFLVNLTGGLRNKAGLTYTSSPKSATTIFKYKSYLNIAF